MTTELSKFGSYLHQSVGAASSKQAYDGRRCILQSRSGANTATVVEASCSYAVTRGTFPLTSQNWEEGDVYEQGSARDTAQYADTSVRR